jgi:hypothetical protein
MVCTFVISALGKQRQEDGKFKATWAAQGTMSQNKNNNKKTKQGKEECHITWLS